MKNILFITNSLGFGGAEKMVTFVANSMADRGHKVCIVNLNSVPEYVNLHRRNLTENVSTYEMCAKENKTAWNKIRFVCAMHDKPKGRETCGRIK